MREEVRSYSVLDIGLNNALHSSNSSPLLIVSADKPLASKPGKANMRDTTTDRDMAKYLCDYCEDIAQFNNGDISVCSDCLPAAEYDLGITD